VIGEVGKQMYEDAVFGPDLLTSPHAERVDKLGNSGIEFKVIADTQPIRQWALTGEFDKAPQGQIPPGGHGDTVAAR
jgi:hypothetical protein